MTVTLSEFLNCHNCSNATCEEYVKTAHGWMPVEYKCLYNKEAECFKNFIKNLPEVIKIMKEIMEKVSKK